MTPTTGWIQVALCFVYGIGCILLRHSLTRQSVTWSRRQGFRTAEKPVCWGFLLFGIVLVGIGLVIMSRLLAGRPPLPLWTPPASSLTKPVNLAPLTSAYAQPLIGAALVAVGMLLLLFRGGLARSMGAVGRRFMSSWDGRLSARIGVGVLALFWLAFGLLAALGGMS